MSTGRDARSDKGFGGVVFPKVSYRVGKFVALVTKVNL